MLPHPSIHPPVHKQQDWSKADCFPALLQPLVMVKLEVPGRAPFPAWGRPWGLCRRAVAPTLQDPVFSFLL